MVLEKPVYYLGLLTTSHYLLRVLKFIFLFVRQSSLPRYLHGTNSWALVTGASSGIGFGFAQELCRRGFNVVLHGRNPVKLARLKADLNRQYPDRSIRIAVADALRSDLVSPVEDIASTVRDLHLTVLINNIGGLAGIVTPDFKTLDTHTAREVDDTINLNDRFATQLTRALLPVLVKNQPSLILNVGSMATVMRMPYLSVYAAAKAYDMAFSSNLAAEMKAERREVEVLGILVGNVQTEARPGLATSTMTPSARVMARAALERVGCGRSVVHGYLPHALQQASLDCLPDALLGIFVQKEAKQLRENAEMIAKVA